MGSSLVVQRSMSLWETAWRCKAPCLDLEAPSDAKNTCLEYERTKCFGPPHAREGATSRFLATNKTKQPSSRNTELGKNTRSQLLGVWSAIKLRRRVSVMPSMMRSNSANVIQISLRKASTYSGHPSANLKRLCLNIAKFLQQLMSFLVPKCLLKASIFLILHETEYVFSVLSFHCSSIYSTSLSADIDIYIVILRRPNITKWQTVNGS